MNVPKKSQRLLGVRGFTLVELMVALSGGLMVAMTMFVLAKNATRFYQREIRAANATTGVLNGFARLRADVARAGFLGSPNLRKDPRICNNPFLVGSAPTAVKELASIQLRSVTKSGTPTAEAGITPHELILTGAYTTADQFKVRAIVQEAGSVGIYLEPQSEAMSRLGSIVSIDENVLRQVFIVNQLARIVDQTGKHHYGVVSTVTGGANPKITLSNSTAIQFRGSGNNGGCGLTGNESEALINPVNIIRYRLANLSAIPEYAGAYRSVDATIPIDATRLDLIREMLDATGTPIANTTELVAEYAVDLRFELTVAPNTGVSLFKVPIGQEANWAAPTTALGANLGPQLIRTIRPRLSVRSSEGDREENIANPIAGGGLYRIGLGPGGTAPFARVRTLQSEVALHNQLDAIWQ